MGKIITPGRYAVVASTAALVMALGGPAAAVNTVRSGDIVNGAVKSADIGNNEVTGADVKNNSVTGADIADGTVSGVDVADDSVFSADIRDATVAGIDILNGEVGPIDLAPGTISWARVASDGTLVSQRGVNASSRLSTGDYSVEFAHSFGPLCAVSVTPGHNSGLSATYLTTLTPNATGVSITDYDGDNRDAAFSIIVVC